MLQGVARLREYVERVFARPAAVAITRLSRSRHFGFIALCLVIGIFVIGHSAHAFDLNDIGDKAILIVGDLLNLLIFALGKLLIVLVGVLIKIASYNNFVKAQPVQFGWVLVRDLTNMFFIVILLVSAFATIIGYPADFHYSKVLPKLLLMAVLINFSKTLIGLLIDFSQVIMLTFVSAFQQAAGGNFVKALKLDQLTTMSSEHPGATATAELFAAAVFGLFMLLISITIIVIMIAFLVFRIITLWMLLIISPLAFFATALPSKIGSQLGGIGGDFWTKLKQALVAGPIMAFFLWLALAVVQSAPEPFGDVYSVKDATTETTNAVNFATKAGNGGAIAQFIVVVAFLLEGVEYAASTATKGIVPKSVMSGLGIGGGTGSQIVSGFLKKNKYLFAAGTGAGAVAGLAAGVGVTGAAYGAGMAGAAGAGYLSRNAIGAGVAKATKGKFDPRTLPVYLGKGEKGAAQLMGFKERGQQVRSDLEKKMKFLDFASKQKKLEKQAKSFDLTVATAAQTMLADMAMSGGSQKELSKQYEAELLKKNPTMSVEQAAAIAERKAVEKRSEYIAAGSKSADTLKLGDRKEAYDKVLADTPALAKDFTKHAEKKNASITDWKKHMEAINKDAMKDSATFFAEGVALGLIDEKTGNIIRNASNEEKWERMESGDRGRFVQAHVNRYSSDPNAVLAQLQAMDNPSESNVAAANAARTYVTKVKDAKGRMQSVAVPWIQGSSASAAGLATAPAAYIPSTPKNEARITAQKAILNALPPTALPATRVSSQQNILLAGGNFEDAFKFNKAQAAFPDTNIRSSYEIGLENAALDLSMALPDAYKKIAALDLEALESNRDGYNEARAGLAQKVKAGQLREAYTQAEAAGDQDAKRRILEVTNILVTEGERIKKIATKNGVNLNELQTYASNPTDPVAYAAAKDMVDSGAVKDFNEAAAAAQALDTRELIEASQGFRTIRNTLLAHAKTSAANARARRYTTR